MMTDRRGEVGKAHGVEVTIIDDLSTQYFVRDAEGKEFFIFRSEFKPA